MGICGLDRCTGTAVFRHVFYVFLSRKTLSRTERLLSGGADIWMGNVSQTTADTAVFIFDAAAAEVTT